MVRERYAAVLDRGKERIPIHILHLFFRFGSESGNFAEHGRLMRL